MANMANIPGTPDWIRARGGSSSTTTANTQVEDKTKADNEVKNDQQYAGTNTNGGGEQGKAQ